MENENFISPEPFNPGVGSSYSIGWELMKKYFLELLLLVIISMAIQIPVQLMMKSFEIDLSAGTILLGIIGIVLSIVVGIPISYGIDYINLKLVRGGKFDVADLFTGFKENYLNVVLSGILAGAIIIAGMLFLIIPGIIFSVKLAFVPYLVMDKKLDAVDAVKTSWNMTTGHSGTIFLMGLLAIPIFILGFVLLIVGIFPAMIWVTAAFAAMYHSVDLEKYPNNIATEEKVD